MAESGIYPRRAVHSWDYTLQEWLCYPALHAAPANAAMMQIVARLWDTWLYYHVAGTISSIFTAARRRRL